MDERGADEEPIAGADGAGNRPIVAAMAMRAHLPPDGGHKIDLMDTTRWGPYAARRTRFSSRRYSMTACCCRLIQPEKRRRQKASGGGSGSIGGSLTQVHVGSKRGLYGRS